MVNKANINRVIEHLRADQGKHFAMEQWVCRTDQIGTDVMDIDDRIERWQDCQTAMCIGGTANLFRMQDSGIDYKALEDFAFHLEFAKEEAAAAWLGLEHDVLTTDRLFRLYLPGRAHFWEYTMNWFDKQPPQFRAAAGIRVLEILRDEARSDWGRALEDAFERFPEVEVPDWWDVVRRHSRRNG